MYQITGKGGSGKGFLLASIGFNTLETKAVARALVKGNNVNDNAVAFVNKGSSSSRMFWRENFDQAHMTYDSYDEMIKALEKHKISKDTAYTLLSSDSMFKCESGGFVTSELTNFANLTKGDFYKFTFKGGFCISFIRVGAYPETPEVDYIDFVDSWLSTSCLLGGCEVPGILTLIYEGVAMLPDHYTYDKGRQSTAELNEKVREKVIELNKEWKKVVKSKRLQGQIASLHKTSVACSVDELNELPSELRDIVAEYLECIGDVKNERDFSIRSSAEKVPVTGNVLACHDENGDPLVISGDPATTLFGMFESPCFIDSILPLAFSPGTALAGGISSKALLVSAQTTFTETFVTFPVGSFLGDDNVKWEPFLTGVVSHAGTEERLKPPFHFTSRFTYRTTQHLLFDEVKGPDDTVWTIAKPGVMQGSCYVLRNGKPFAVLSDDTLTLKNVLRLSHGVENLDIPAFLETVEQLEKKRKKKVVVVKGRK